VDAQLCQIDGEYFPPPASTPPLSTCMGRICVAPYARATNCVPRMNVQVCYCSLYDLLQSCARGRGSHRVCVLCIHCDTHAGTITGRTCNGSSAGAATSWANFHSLDVLEVAAQCRAFVHACVKLLPGLCCGRSHPGSARGFLIQLSLSDPLSLSLALSLSRSLALSLSLSLGAKAHDNDQGATSGR